MLRRIGWCLVVLLFICNHVYGINALPGYTVFYKPGQAGTPYIEVYWQVDPQTVDYKKNEQGVWVAKITTILELSDDTGIVAKEKYYLQTTPAASLLAAQLQNIMDVQRYAVKPGKVRIRLMLLQEEYTKPAYIYIDSLKADTVGNYSFSGIQLLDTFYKTEVKNNLFVKNGSLQVPLAMNFVDDFRRNLHYYTEIYGTDKLAAGELPLVQHTSITKTEYDYPFMNLKRTDTLKPGVMVPSYGSLDITYLPSGNYYLSIVLQNGKGADLARRSVFFQRSNTNPPPPPKDTTTGDSGRHVFEKVNVFDLSTTFVYKYHAAQLKAILKMLKPVANEMELLNIEGFAKKPDETYMQYFVYNFWKTRSPYDVDKGWEEYTKKVREVNKLFGSGSKPGYETERGFFYLKYGPPDQRYVVSAEEGAMPYEVWVYNAPGKQSSQGAFLFFNPGFMGNDYRMLHSTVQGEMRNANWRSDLYKNGGVSQMNNNSRAEQTFPER